ncbi:MAG: lipoprotein [Terracidiphilus sp.]
MKKRIIFLAGALLLLAGCNSGNQASNTPQTPKWKGAPYRLAFDTKPVKPNPAGITLPGIKFTANPEDVETRADLVVQVDVSGVKQATQVPDMMIMAPTDISGSEGALSADYLDLTNKELAKMLAGYCMKGKVKLSVALARSSLNMTSTDDQIDAKRLSDWLPIELEFKNPHPKC